MNEIDKISMKVLRTLYQHSLSQDSFNDLIRRDDMTQPNEIESFLLREKLIRVEIRGEEDGEGGLIPGTVSRHYFIRRRGMAVVELANKDRLSNLLSLLSQIPFGT